MKSEGKLGKDQITKKRKIEHISIRSTKKEHTKEENTLKAQHKTSKPQTPKQVVDQRKKTLLEGLESEILTTDSAKQKKKKKGL